MDKPELPQGVKVADAMPPVAVTPHAGGPVAGPDAILIAEPKKTANTHVLRHEPYLELARRVLGIPAPCLRSIPGSGAILITRTINDTLNFPQAHKRAMTSRYRWEDQPDGIKFGFLVEGADDDA
jgi:hypothetical protein